MPSKRLFIQFALFILCFGTLSAATDNRTVWYVLQGATGGNGTLESPLGSVMEINDCTGTGDTIKILPSEMPLDGLITLKEGQTLKGIGPCVTQLNEGDYDTVAHAQVTNTSAGEGAIRLGNNAKVINVHVRNVAPPESGPPVPAVSGDAGGANETLLLKDLLVTHSGNASGLRGISLFFFAETQATLKDVIVKKIEPDPQNPEPDEWFSDGIRVIAVTGPTSIDLTRVEVENAGSATTGGIRFTQAAAEPFNLFSLYTKTTNIIGDHYLISGSNTGQVNVETHYHQSNFSDAARAAVVNVSTSLDFGSDFGYEVISQSSPVNIKVRNSLFTNGIGPGVAIFLADVTANLDFGTEDDLGNNAIFNNVTGSEFTDYLLEPDGQEALFALFGFNLINQGASGAENNIGPHVNLFLDGFASQQLCAEGNFWGTDVGPEGPAPCLELEFFETGEANDIEMQQNNPGEFSPSNPWGCISANTFSDFMEFMQQPKTGNALQKNPYE